MENSQANGTQRVYATSEPQLMSLPSRHSQYQKIALVKTVVVQPMIPVMNTAIIITVQKSITSGFLPISAAPFQCLLATVTGAAKSVTGDSTLQPRSALQLILNKPKPPDAKEATNRWMIRTVWKTLYKPVSQILINER